MFKKVRKNLQSQAAGSQAVESVAELSIVSAPTIHSFVKACCETNGKDHSVAIERLFAVYLFHYLMREKVMKEVESVYHETTKEDVAQFFSGAQRAMRRHPMFGDHGIATAENLARAILDYQKANGLSRSDTAPREAYGKWLLNALGLKTESNSSYDLLGEALERAADSSLPNY